MLDAAIGQVNHLTVNNELIVSHLNYVVSKRDYWERMGGCQSSTPQAEQRRVQWTDDHDDGGDNFDGVSSNSAGGNLSDQPRQLRTAPTLNRVIVFKSTLADSSDEENVENEVYSSEEEETGSTADRASVRSTSNDFSFIPDLSADEKRVTPFQFDWMHDMPRSPEERHRTRSIHAAAEAEKKRLAELEELNRPPSIPPERRATIGPVRDLKELLDHKPPPTDRLVFVNFNNLKFDVKNRKPRTSFPRNPGDEDLAEAILENPVFSRPDTFMVFVSHEWVGEMLPETAGGGKGRKCDTDQGDKYRLLLKAIETTWETLAPGMANCYVWCDHFCLNQDKDTGAYTGVSLLNLNICNIMRLCDVVITPVLDIDGYSSWEYPATGPSADEVGAALAGRDGVDWYKGYKSVAFQGVPMRPADIDVPNSSDTTVEAGLESSLGEEGKAESEGAGTDRARPGSGYLQRAWCRLEMYCDAAVPLLDEWIDFGLKSKPEEDKIKQAKMEHEKKILEKRHKSFRGSLLSAAKHGIRPHYLYGTKEEMSSLGPILLPRLTKQHSEELYALEGACTDEAVDKTLIDAVLKQIDKTVQPLVDGGQQPWWRKEMYSGSRDSDGLKHGFGTYTWADNSSYTGPWTKDQATGKGGKLCLANGDTVEGSFNAGKPHGFCTYTALIGDIYFGELSGKLEKQGQGKIQYANGDAYEGYWANNQRNYKGRFTYSEGDQFTGFFKNGKMHGYGTWKYIDGGEYSGYFKNNRRHGEGTFHSSEDIVFTGTYRKGKKHGPGTTTYKDGLVMKAEFEEGKQVGQGRWSRLDSVGRDGETVEGDTAPEMDSPSAPKIPHPPINSTPMIRGKRLAEISSPED